MYNDIYVNIQKILTSYVSIIASNYF